MANDYIPRPDAQFHAWQNNFIVYVNNHLADLGLEAADVVDLNNTAATWTTDYPAHTAAQTAAQAARQAKDGARDGFEGVIRPLALDTPHSATRNRSRSDRRTLSVAPSQGLVRRLQASPDVDDSERAAMGITVPDREGTPEGPPKTRPVVSVDTSQPLTQRASPSDANRGAIPGRSPDRCVKGQRLQYTIAFADESTPTRKAKPAGVMGAEIWVKVGDPPPTGPSELSFLSVDTRTPYVADYPGEDGGKPLTRGSGKGSKPLRRECRNQQVDRLSARAAVLERSLPLPGLFRRLALFEVDQLDWQAGLGGANLGGPVLGQTPEQVVRASVVAASVAAA